MEDQVQAAMEVADHLHADSLAASQKVAEAFDTCWEATDELIVDTDWVDDEEGRKKKKVKLAEVGKRANDAAVRALPKAVFSEYQTVCEFVIPHMIEKYGKLVLRANEQGQEAAGQMIKKMIKSGKATATKESNHNFLFEYMQESTKGGGKVTR